MPKKYGVCASQTETEQPLAGAHPEGKYPGGKKVGCWECDVCLGGSATTGAQQGGLEGQLRKWVASRPSVASSPMGEQGVSPSEPISSWDYRHKGPQTRRHCVRDARRQALCSAESGLLVGHPSERELTSYHLEEDGAKIIHVHAGAIGLICKTYGSVSASREEKASILLLISGARRRGWPMGDIFASF
jgi:hypothetical protein